MEDKKRTLLYSILAIIPLGIPIGLMIYAYRNRADLKNKVKDFKLRMYDKN